jgi:hypothetical protein
MLFGQLSLPEGNNLLIYGGVAGGGLLVMVLLVLLVFRGKKKVDPEGGLGEDLSTFPAAPTGKRHYQLSVLNTPVRLRLVVVAPVGKRPVGKVDSVLEQILRGLGEVSIDDKPRIRVWPPQLSTAGFAPTFFRLTKKPEAEGKPSRWVLLAGPARSGSAPVLVALACQTDAPTKMGLITLTETQWNEVLRVEHA